MQKVQIGKDQEKNGLRNQCTISPKRKRTEKNGSIPKFPASLIYICTLNQIHLPLWENYKILYCQAPPVELVG